MSWRQLFPWILISLPWLGLVVAFVLGSSGRLSAEQVAPLRRTVLLIAGLEILLGAFYLRRRIAFGLWVDGVRRGTNHFVANLKEAAVGFLRFTRRHKPAIAGVVLILIMVTAAAGSEWIAPYPPMQGLQIYNAPASSQFWLGTDAQGRDLFSRLVWGARYTLLIALAATMLSLLFGTIIGALAGFFGGALDTLLMRAIDFMMSFPSFLLAVVTVAVLGKSLENLIWAVGLVGIPLCARQVRAEVLRISSLEFVDAARSLGASPFHVLIRTVLPNCVTPIIVLATLGMGSAILDVAGLAFLGLGGDPFVPEWGLILKLGWDESSKGAFQVGVSGACILGTVLGFNLLGDGLRDWLDPRMRQGRL